MEHAPLTILISVLVHGIAIGALAAHSASLPDKPLPKAPSVELVEPEAVDVVMLSAPELDRIAAVDPVPTEPETPIEPRSQLTPKRPAIATTRATTSEVGAQRDPAPIDPRAINPLFAMRGSGASDRPAQPQIDLRLPRRDSIDYVPRGTDAVADVPESGELAPSGGGTYRSDKGVFTARVNKDGTVDLKNSRNLRISVPDPRKIPKAVGNHVSEWAANDNKLPGDPEKVAINNHRSGGGDTRPDHGKTVPVLGGGFDVTDALMRRKKVDPYAAAKLRYLDSTRDERVQIGTRYKKQQLAQSAQLMQKQLDVLDRLASKATVAQRKEALFELWDDCAETGDAALVEGGRAARALVIGYIRARLTGADAYTADELAVFNRRKQSKAVFAP